MIRTGSAPAVTIVDVDLATEAVWVSGADRNTAATPGSTLKPMVLLTALQLGLLTPQTRIACTGNLIVAGRNLACAHPRSLGILDAEEALAYSCNSYFASIARQMPLAALDSSLQRYGLHVATPATSPAQRVLLALGLNGVSVTPLQLARAYVQLARALPHAEQSGAAVRSGLLGSVIYGMAHAAQTPQLVLGGKTGTAHDPAPLLQHGWFAGIVFASAGSMRANRVVVAYAPGGSGNDAASAAHRYLQSRYGAQ